MVHIRYKIYLQTVKINILCVKNTYLQLQNLIKFSITSLEPVGKMAIFKYYSTLTQIVYFPIPESKGSLLQEVFKLE